MGPAPIPTAFLLTSLTVVILLEMALAAMGSWMGLTRLWLLTITRSAQAASVVVLSVVLTDGPHVIGLDKENLLPGLKKGLLWSAGFAGVAGLLFLVLIIAGQNPFLLIRSPLPASVSQRLLFFCVGGLIAPIAEEIVFRGLIFGYLRRWGTPAAVLISTALFAAIHLGPSIPITQIVGGAVFAMAYQAGKSLMTPIVIHMLGNLAIFTLSLPVFR